MMKTLRALIGAIFLFVSTAQATAVIAQDTETQQMLDAQFNPPESQVVPEPKWGSLLAWTGHFLSENHGDMFVSTVVAGVAVAGFAAVAPGVTAALAVGAGRLVVGTALGYVAERVLTRRKEVRAWVRGQAAAAAIAVRDRAKTLASRVAAVRDRLTPSPMPAELVESKYIEDAFLEQGQRVASARGFDPSFSGVGESDEGMLTYSGRRQSGNITGGYVLQTDGQRTSGQFLGQIQRNGQISGTYVEGQERGSFKGQATPNLDRVFAGGSACESGCD